MPKATQPHSITNRVPPPFYPPATPAKPPKPTRRGLFGAGAALIAGAGALPLTMRPATADVDDDALLTAYQTLLRAEDDRTRLDAVEEPDPPSSEEDAAWESDVDDMLARWHGAADLIRDTPARTSAGLHAKAHAMEIVLANLVCSHAGETIADLDKAGAYQDTFALSLARDVLAGVAA
jgi:hypothetical protein